MENSFKKYGFEEPEFKGEILKEVNGTFVGYIMVGATLYAPTPHAMTWDYNGRMTMPLLVGDGDRCDLTPIKKEWYEEDNAFPRLMTDGIRFIVVDGYDKERNVLKNRHYSISLDTPMLRLATDEEIDSFKKRY